MDFKVKLIVKILESCRFDAKREWFLVQ